MATNPAPRSDQSTNHLLQAFEEFLTADGKGTQTIISYTGDIKGFMTWLTTKDIDFQGQLSRFYITSYKENLLDNHYSMNTINKKLNSLHSFNLFLLDQQLCNEKVVHPRKDKIKIAKGSEKEIGVFTNAEIEKILFYLEDKNRVTSRDKAVIIMLLYTGLRVGEMVNIKLKDTDLLTLSVKVVGKGGKYREVPLKAEVKEAITHYLDEERRNSKFLDSEYLFITQRSHKMDKDTINKLLNKHGKALDLVFYPHKFRHTFCTQLIQKGVELTTVSQLAGHANIQTTASFYIHTSREDKQNAINLL